MRQTALMITFWLASVLLPTHLLATDYFIAVGGGYEPRGNQASLEANILFFRSVLVEAHRGNRSETTFFADGDDDEPDLQVAVDVPEGPLAELLSSLNRRGGGPAVEYRNHQVTNLAGPLRPSTIRNSLERLSSILRLGDRLIVYVTAHGEPAEDDEEYNTYISCWNRQRFSAREFTQWLDDVPSEVPVVLVMAQCYCGGFSHTIFQEADASRGIDNHLRCGFFAQQHDLPAAGCRPDIANDEEYSSYFWGAFVGRSRNGRPLVNVDANGDGRVSFAEAHAQAVIACHSIDIPLRSSEALLRYYSRIDGYEHRGAPDQNDSENQAAGETDGEKLQLHAMLGSIHELANEARNDVRTSIESLVAQLDLAMTDDVTKVFEASASQDSDFGQLRRQSSRGRRGRSSSGRRELREAIVEKWPELGDREGWLMSPLLAADKQSEIIASLSELPSYKQVVEAVESRAKTDRALDEAELKSIKFQRLIGLLETIVLVRNLPQLASPDVVEQYRRIVSLEESSW